MSEENIYTSMYSRNAELYHHGIKGQKWGVTNGPPYPLSDDISTGKRLKKIENKVNTFSDQELEQKLKRLRMETEYSRLEKQLTSKEKNKVASFLEKNTEKSFALVSTLVITALTKKALDSLLK